MKARRLADAPVVTGQCLCGTLHDGDVLRALLPRTSPRGPLLSTSAQGANEGIRELGFRSTSGSPSTSAPPYTLGELSLLDVLQ
jgi:hypothetical protein